jgi:hypothetical protein
MASDESRKVYCDYLLITALDDEANALHKALQDLSAAGPEWAAPHFLVHLKWEFLERFIISGEYHNIMLGHLLLLSQDALNSFGVA